MRTIKFRGKDARSGEWVYGGFVTLHIARKNNHDELLGYDEVPSIFNDEPGQRQKGGYWHSVIPETVGQLTGLRDKNGRDIYEGDILRSDDYPFCDDGNDNYMGVVFCDTGDAVGMFQVMLFVLKSSEKRGISNFINKCFYDLDLTKVEVIGNIFDNKGLFRDSDEKILKWYLED